MLAACACAKSVLSLKQTKVFLYVKFVICGHKIICVSISHEAKKRTRNLRKLTWYLFFCEFLSSGFSEARRVQIEKL